jgi:serine/threonine protein kinase
MSADEPDVQGNTPSSVSKRETAPSNGTPATRISTAQDPLIGAHIGNYAVVCPLGSGGFGTVYKARDTRLGRDVALKFLHPSFPRSQVELGNEGERERISEEHRRLFEREARALAALSKHPNILQIHAWGEYQERSYLVLEYVELNARILLDQAPDGISTAFALRIASDCAEALSCAHRQGILHRDVKPANILIEAADQRVKLADFGIARFYERGSMTLSGRISGSPPYMSPEQASGQSVDERSDIFSLGVTLYELLSGKRPFEGATSEELMEHIRNDERIPLAERRHDLPPLILDIVENAIAHDPAKRFQSAESFAQGLRLALGCVRENAPALQKGLPRTTSRSLVPKLNLGTRGTYRRAAAVLLLGVMGLVIAVLYVRSGRNSEPFPPALGEINHRLDGGDATSAEVMYLEFLESHPNDPNAQYGLGYSLLRQGKIPDADAAFKGVEREPLRAEGMAAVAFERDGENARGQIEAADRIASCAYLKTLLANLDIGKQDYRNAADRLKRAGEQFHFGWQRAEYLQALGQALFHLGDYVNALRAFEQLRGDASPAAVSLADAYLEIVRGRNDEARRAAVQEKARNIRKLMTETQEQSEAAAPDAWTSRPLRFCLLPARVNSGRIAAESGLADVFPSTLGNALVQLTPMTKVDRELIEEILSEQELSGQLSSGAGKLRLGQILGARLLIECSFESAFQEEFMSLKIVDVETTKQVQVERASVMRSLNLDAWAKEVAGRIWTAVSEAYPIRGRVLRAANDVTTDVGSAVGVRPGMQFRVFTQPDPAHRLPDRSVIVEELVGENSARVRVEGFKADEIPPEGFYIAADSPALRSQVQLGNEDDRADRAKVSSGTI